MEHQDFDQYQRLVDAALDGELDAARESQLYERLAADAALRDTLRGAQAIRSATRAYSSSMTPPADLGAALFARLGIDTAATVTTQKGHKNPIIGRAGFLPTLGLVLLLSGGLLTYFLTSSNSSAPSVTVGPVQKTPALPAPDPVSSAQRDTRAQNSRTESAARTESADARSLSAQPAAPVSSPASRAKTGASNNEATINKATIVREAPTPGTTRTSEKSGHSESGTRVERQSSSGGSTGTGTLGTQGTAASLVPPVTTAATGTKAEEMLPASAASVPAPTLGVQEIPTHQPLEPMAGLLGIDGRGTDFIRDLRSQYPLRSGLSAHRLLLRLRGYGLSPSPSTDIGPRSSPLVNNMAAALFYNLGSEHALGLEGGQEAYPQEYDGTENGRTVRYQQNLLTPWIGVAYRYRPLWARSEAGVSGTLATHAGITREYWPQLRLALGMQVAVLPPLSLELGIEGLLIAYPFQDRWFTTRKIGVTYGLLVTF